VKTVQSIVSATGALALVALLVTAAGAAYDDAARAYNKGDFAAAFQEYRVLGEAGDIRAQVNVGWMYQVGQGTAPDPVQAAAWYARAAEHGHEIARYNLGYAYEEGVPRDLAKALRWYAQAAQQGNAEAKKACVRVQKLLAARDAPPRPSPVEKNAAKAEVAPAKRQDTLPILLPVSLAKQKENPRVARARLAAEAGDLDALVFLGWCYSSGRWVSQNKTEAMVWYRLAGEQGRVDAQLALGWMNYLGEGDLRDLSESAAWYQMAADQGNLKAKRMLKKIAREAGQGRNQQVSQAR